MKKFKKLIAGVLVICCIFSATVNIAFADEPGVITVFVDGVQIEFDVAPITESDRTLVPMRAIFEALGAEVTWDEATLTATAVKGGDVMYVTIDSNMLYKNGESVELDVPARMVGDRTLVPVRAISESFDALVEWDETTLQVIITTETEPPASPTPSATATPDNTPIPTQTPPKTEEELIPATELSDADFETLMSQREVIRYSLEQYNLPEYVFENSDDIYDKMKNDDGGFFNDIVNMWDRSVSGAVVAIQVDSEENYLFDEGFFDKLETADSIEAIYGDMFERAGLTFDNFVEDMVILEDAKTGDYMTVIAFKNADSLVQCKYISIVAAQGKAPRYFTAENDILDDENWYFCEVTASGRGTIGIFEKNEQSLDNFVGISFAYYNED